MRRLDLAAGLLVVALLLERRDLGLGQHHPLLGDLPLERREPMLEGLQAVAKPHPPDAGR